MAENNQYTPVDQISGIVEAARKAFESGKSRPYDWRIEQLQGIVRGVNENRDAIVEACQQDMGRPKSETILAENGFIISNTKHIIKNLSTWMKPRAVATPVVQMKGMSASKIAPQAKGVVLIISPWNYPISLSVSAVAEALAAGNTVVLKPSEVSAHATAVVVDILKRYTDNECVKVVLGGVKETTELLKERFDHILYTGNATVGRIVAAAAAKHLTPVTLELGGKSPVYIDKDVDIDVAARRIIWGKFVNCGQTCIAPDYALVHSNVKDKLLVALQAVIKQFYTENPKESKDFGRVINQRQFDRLTKLLEGEKSVAGGSSDSSQLYIAPTILHPVDAGAPVMQEEIFGPILPVLEVADENAAIRFINERPHPLALYVFSSHNSVPKKFIEATRSGSVVVNDTLMQFAVSTLPFGGVGESGTGAYHGQFGFETFSHMRSVLDKTTWFDVDVRYPPYSDNKLWQVEQMTKL